MTNYMYCPTCKKVTLAELRRKPDGTQSKVCTACGRENGGLLDHKKCPVCGSVLYFPYGTKGIEFPCAAQHGRVEAQTAASDDGDVEAISAMLEIPCPNCPTETLQMKNGAYESCPVCGMAPSMAYIQQCWRKHSKREPAIIQWRDATGRKLLHVDKRPLLPFSLLVVGANQHVIYEGDGIQKPLEPRVYAMFKENYTDRQIVSLANKAEDAGGWVEDFHSRGLSLGLGARIIFFSELRHPFTVNCEYPSLINKWSVVIPVEGMMHMTIDNAENLMSVAWDLTDDDKATASLKDLVRDQLSSQIRRIFLEHRRDPALLEMEDEYDVEAWVIRLFSGEKLEEIRNAAQNTLTALYGITLPDLSIFAHRIKVTRINAGPAENTVEVVCTANPTCPDGVACGHVNHVAKEIVDHHKPFTCEKCGNTLYWCPNCSKYRTQLRRERVCDVCDHGIH